MPLSLHPGHQSWWPAILISMPRVLFVPAQLSALISEAPSSCHPLTQHLHAGGSNVRDPSTGLFYPARSKLTEGLYTVTSMLPITIPSLSRSRLPDNQEPARPHALTVLSLGPKARAYRRNTWAQTVQIGFELGSGGAILRITRPCGSFVTNMNAGHAAVTTMCPGTTDTGSSPR